MPLDDRRTENRCSTRFYDHEYLNDDRKVRTDDVDEYSSSPSGPAALTIRTNARFAEPFDVPGDDSTVDVVTDGVIWDIQGANDVVRSATSEAGVASRAQQGRLHGRAVGPSPCAHEHGR